MVLVCQQCGSTIKRDKAITNSFKLKVKDVFEIPEKGTEITGFVESGTINEGDFILINGITKYKVIGMESNRQRIKTASANMGIGILIGNVPKNNISVGSVVTKFM